MEIWHDVRGYEGIYQVSNIGNVRSLDRICNGVRVKGQYKKQSINSNGYRVVNLVYCGKQRLGLVHRLVATAFIDNPHDKQEVNHIDGDKTNNNVKNLEWVTGDENMEHAFSIGLLQRQPVIMDGYIKFDSITKCAKYLGVDHHEIRRALNGEYKTVHGHSFERSEAI